MRTSVPVHPEGCCRLKSKVLSLIWTLPHCQANILIVQIVWRGSLKKKKKSFKNVCEKHSPEMATGHDSHKMASNVNHEPDVKTCAGIMTCASLWQDLRGLTGRAVSRINQAVFGNVQGSVLQSTIHSLCGAHQWAATCGAAHNAVKLLAEDIKVLLVLKDSQDLTSSLWPLWKALSRTVRRFSPTEIEGHEAWQRRRSQKPNACDVRKWMNGLYTQLFHTHTHTLLPEALPLSLTVFRVSHGLMHTINSHSHTFTSSPTDTGLRESQTSCLLNG